MSVWINSLAWFGFTALFSCVTFMLDKFFRGKDKRIGVQEDELERIKSKKFKSVEEQKSYVRGRFDLGKDFVFTVLNIFLFFIGFRLLVYPFVDSLLIGVFFSICFASLFAFVSARYILPSKFFWRNFFSKLISISFIGVLLVYLKVVDAFPGWVMVIGTLAVLFGFSFLLKKFFGGKKNGCNY